MSSLPTSTRPVVLTCLAGFALAGCVYADSYPPPVYAAPPPRVYAPPPVYAAPPPYVAPGPRRAWVPGHYNPGAVGYRATGAEAGTGRAAA